MKKKLLTCLMVLPMLAALGSCGGTPSSTPVEPSTPSTLEPVVDGYKVTINNKSLDRSLGRVEVSKREGIESGEEITFTVKTLKEYADLEYLKIDGKEVELAADLTYKMTVNANVEVEVSFVSPRLLTMQTPLSFNEGDTPFTLWDSTNTVIDTFHKKGEGKSGWDRAGFNAAYRYITIIDAEGYIMYASAMPANGYGGPGDLGTYHNPTKYEYPSWGEKNTDGSYKKIPENITPCFKIQEGFGSWSSEAKGGIWENFELVIPEGCYAITGHMQDSTTLSDFLYQIKPENTEVLPLEPEEKYLQQYNSINNPFFGNDLRIIVEENKGQKVVVAYNAKPAAPAAE